MKLISLKLYFLIVLLMAITITSCSVFSDPEEQVLVTVKTSFELELSQKLKAGPNQLELIISTLNPPKCEDSELEVYNNIAGNHLQLNLANIILPYNCEPAKKSISSSSVFEVSPGNYEIDLDVLSTFTNHGILHVEPHNFQLQFNNIEGILFEEKSMLVIPDGLVWGEIAISHYKDQDALDSFSSELKETLNPPGLRTGYYGHFTIGDDKLDVYRLPNVEGGERHPFLYKYTNTQQLSEIKEKYTQAYPNLHISMITSEGIVI